MRKEFIILLIAFAIRIFPAYLFHGSFDIDNAHYIANLISCGKNVYHNSTYNYLSPWLFFLYSSYYLKTLSLPFYFVIKLGPVIADVISALYIFKIVKFWEKKTAYLASFVFAINPVSILITSFHGQFDSIPLMMLVVSIYYLYIKRLYISSVLFGLAIAFKTWPIILFPVFAYQVVRLSKKNMPYLLISLLVPIIIIFPSLIYYTDGVINNVLLYKGTHDFGISVILLYLKQLPSFANFAGSYLLLSKPILGLSTFAVLIYIFIRKISLNQSIILLLLSFYVVSPNIGAQYLVWIIPFLILDNLKINIIYTIISTTALFASYLGFQSKSLLSLLPYKIEYSKNLIPWGETMVVWWIGVFIIFIYYVLLSKPNKNSIPVSLIRLNLAKILVVLLLSFLISTALLLPPHRNCDQFPLEHYLNNTFI